MRDQLSTSVGLASGAAALALAQWLVPVLIGRKLGPEAVGVYGLAIAIVVPVAFAVGGQLRTLIATDQQRRYLFTAIIRFRALGSMLAMLVLTGLAVSLSGPVGAAVLALGAARLADTWAEVGYGVEQRNHRFDHTIRTQWVRAALIAVSVWIALSAGGGVVEIGIAWALGSVVVLLLRELPAAQRMAGETGPRASGPDRSVSLRLLAASAVPLAAVQVQLSISAYLPRYLLQWHRGLTAVGVFTAAYALLAVGTPMFGAIGQMITPRVASLTVNLHTASIRRLVTRLLLCVIAMDLVLIGGVYLWGDRVMSLVFGPAFAGYGSLVVIIAVAMALAYINSILGYVVTAMGVHGRQAVTTFVMLLVSMLAAVLLIPGLGLMGAGMVLVCTGLAQNVMLGLLLRARFREIHGMER